MPFVEFSFNFLYILHSSSRKKERKDEALKLFMLRDLRAKHTRNFERIFIGRNEQRNKRKERRRRLKIGYEVKKESHENV